MSKDYAIYDRTIKSTIVLATKKNGHRLYNLQRNIILSKI